jgi:hypothetical protein
LKLKIETLARQAGRLPGEFIERARQMRRGQAKLFKPFESLRTVEGDVRTFEDVRSKVTLVNFFFPT